MRILVVTYEFPPVGGGGGQAAQDISLGLAKKGHAVQVLTAHLDGLARQESVQGLPVVRVPSARRHAYQADLLAMGGFVVAGLWAGWRLVRRWRPDVIHVHFAVPSGPVAWLLSRFTRIPYVLTAHLGDVPGGVPEKTGRWFRWVYPFTPAIWRRAARVAAVSEYTRQLALQHYPVEMRVIPNGVDLEKLDPGEIRVGNPPSIVFAGRFQPQKNPLQLVRSLAELRDLPWKCAMLGDGPLRPAVEAEIARQGLADRFTLPGWVNPEEVISWFARSDILFMPSLSEGLPVVGVQSLAMGLAIVCGKAGGFVDLVDEAVNGYMIPNQHPEAYAQALHNLLTEPQKLADFRRASREKARCFDLPIVVDQYESLFSQAIADQEPAK